MVVHPRSEQDVAAALEWALSAGAAVIPFGGGTSVVGGVRPQVDSERYSGVVTVDLKRLDRVLEVSHDGIRREGAILERPRFDRVAAVLRRDYGWA